MPRRRLAPVQLDQIIRWIQEGLSQREVSRRLNVSQSVVSRAWNRFIQNDSVAYVHGGGRQRSTTAAQDRLLILNARRNPTYPASRLNRSLRVATGVLISNQTVRRRLHVRGLRARRRVQHPRLNREHRVHRRQWAEEHRNWTLEDWSRCLFTDESRFRLVNSDGRILAWRERGRRYAEQFMVPTTAFGGGSICVWGGICLNQRTELVVLQNTTMTSQRYHDMIIEPIIVPFAAAVGENFILIDDNARPHRSRLVNEALETHAIDRMDWPARSPDMNCIEHVWSEMSRQLSTLEQPINNLEDLSNALRDIWTNLPQNFINRLIESMPRRVECLRRARGGPTRY